MYSCPLVVFFFFSPCSETDCTFIYQPQSVLFVPRFCHVLEMTVCWLSAVNKSVFKCLPPFVSLLKSEKVFVFFVYVNVECPPKTKCYSFYNNQRANTRMIAWCPARVSGRQRKSRDPSFSDGQTPKMLRDNQSAFHRALHLQGSVTFLLRLPSFTLVFRRKNWRYIRGSVQCVLVADSKTLFLRQYETLLIPHSDLAY